MKAKKTTMKPRKKTGNMMMNLNKNEQRMRKITKTKTIN